MEYLIVGVQIATLVALLFVWKKAGQGSSIGVTSKDLQDAMSSQRTELHALLTTQSQSTESKIQQIDLSLSEEQRRFAEGRVAAEKNLREETGNAIQSLGDRFQSHTKQSAERQDLFKEQMSERFEALRKGNDEKLEIIREVVGEKLQATLTDSRRENAEQISKLTEQNASKHLELQELLAKQLEALRSGNEEKLQQVNRTVGEKLQTTLTESLEKNGKSIEQLTIKNAQKHLELQELLSTELSKLREGNEAKLEKMRETVDEKLQGTLEKRLGESFQLVSTRLEEVHKGLGEMQTLASDVGGLKRVLTNVKSRGSWGEVQLARQLEDLLSSDQYDSNVAVKPNSSERVEFAVKLPGKDSEGRPVYLPIDSKFPQEDYERLLNATEQGDKDAIELSARALERAVIEQAKSISVKYIEPPFSTDFAIMYLPTEGLFAEVVKRPGLTSKLQNEFRVNVTGPTTLSSLLNSLQMGFRTLAIEKRSSEVWEVLGAAKGEFRKYGEVWAKLEKQLSTAQNTVKDAGTRTRAIERKLKSVETLVVDAQGETPLLEVALEGFTGDDEGDD